MSHEDFYVTPHEFLEGIKQSFIDAYLDRDKEAFFSRRMHPEDLGLNVAAIAESISAYSTYLIHRRLHLDA